MLYIKEEARNPTPQKKRGDKTFNSKRKSKSVITRKNYVIDRDWILLIILTRKLREYINNMLMYIRSPRIVKICLYGLTMEVLRLILVHINYVMCFAQKRVKSYEKTSI